MDPRVAFEQFLDAVRARDEVRAGRNATRAGWVDEGDTARRWFGQAATIGADAKQSGPERIHAERAAIPAVSFSPAGPGAEVWFLLRRDEGTWRIDGTAAAWPIAALYLKGHFDGPPSFAALPASAAAATWAAAVVRNPAMALGRSQDALLAELLADAAGVTVERTVEIPGSGRAGAALRIAQRDGTEQTVWAILGASRGSETLRPVGRSFVGSLGALTRGLDMPWPLTDEPEEPHRFSDSEAKEILGAALAEALASRGAAAPGSADEMGGRMAGLLAQLFSSNLSEDLPDDDSVVSLDAERRKRRGEAHAPTPTEVRLQQELAESLGVFLQSKQVGEDLTTDDLKIDSAFVRQNGGALASTLIGAFAKALIPPDLAVTVAGTPEAEGEASGPRIKIDLGDLLGGLFRLPPGNPDR